MANCVDETLTRKNGMLQLLSTGPADRMVGQIKLMFQVPDFARLRTAGMMRREIVPALVGTGLSVCTNWRLHITCFQLTIADGSRGIPINQNKLNIKAGEFNREII
jgi:hypothetical protein